ncbi:hypothetical protein [Psychromonas ossibalaenae]|uniref:hypothetical protein n=1 Tax=Psychromonas ossibalaenae TaxID=444922 RepID=UPI000380AB6F|nr:hypothetical protein [Psychromonas ossibalaenae]
MLITKLITKIGLILTSIKDQILIQVGINNTRGEAEASLPKTENNIKRISQKIQKLSYGMKQEVAHVQYVRLESFVNDSKKPMKINTRD